MKDKIGFWGLILFYFILMGLAVWSFVKQTYSQTEFDQKQSYRASLINGEEIKTEKEESNCFKLFKKKKRKKTKKKTWLL